MYATKHVSDQGITIVSFIFEEEEDGEKLYAIFNHTRNTDLFSDGETRQIKKTIGEHYYDGNYKYPIDCVSLSKRGEHYYV